MGKNGKIRKWLNGLIWIKCENIETGKRIICEKIGK